MVIFGAVQEVKIPNVSVSLFCPMIYLIFYQVILRGSGLPFIIMNRNFNFLNPEMLYRLGISTTPVIYIINI